jgi:organic radical activating enzyme
MRVNEMFYSIQGEGYFTGNAAVFIRLSGCNIRCPFCDTRHIDYCELIEEKIVDFASKYPSRLVVITGGEPSLQLTDSFVDKLHEIGKFVAVETNGTRQLPHNVDWITVSPKQAFVGDAGKILLKSANEVKVVFDAVHEINDYDICAEHYYIQPCDTGNFDKNKEIVNNCITFIKQNPKWKLSLQTQKILNVQ